MWRAKLRRFAKAPEPSSGTGVGKKSKRNRCAVRQSCISDISECFLSAWNDINMLKNRRATQDQRNDRDGVSPDRPPVFVFPRQSMRLMQTAHHIRRPL
jgi:hypothetical protein